MNSTYKLAYVVFVFVNPLVLECAAYIRVKDDTDGALNDIRAHAKNMLTYFKVPKFIELVDHYPMTVTGKVQKFELRKDAEAKFGES